MLSSSGYALLKLCQIFIFFCSVFVIYLFVVNKIDWLIDWLIIGDSVPVATTVRMRAAASTIFKFVTASFKLNLTSMIRRGYRGSTGACAPPLELWGRGQGGGTICLVNCQNSLKTRLKYVNKNHPALKVDSGYGPHRSFSVGKPGGQKIFARKFTKYLFFSPSWRPYIRACQWCNLKLWGKLC